MQNVVSFDPFVGPEIEQIIPLTQAQAEVWIACEIGGDAANSAYNESVSLILKGNLNRDALENALKKVVKRHQAFRATFSPDGRFMAIHDNVLITPYFEDLSELDSNKKENAVKDYLKGDANFVFDLVNGPLLKIGLLKLSNEEHQLVISAHHIICDGWSMGIMLEELGSFYSAQTLGAMPAIPEPETFASYVEDEQNFLESDAYQKTENFWLEQYKTSVPIFSLPTDLPRPQLRTYNSARYDFAIDNDLVESLKKVGARSGASLVVTLMSAFEVFLYQQTGKDDLVLGLAAAGQAYNDKTQLIGHCANILPLHTRLNASTPFNLHLKERKTALFDAYEHQRFSFGQLLQKLAIARDPSRVPLVPILFNIDFGMSNGVSFAGLEFVLKSNPRAYEAFELFLNVTEVEKALILEWSYNTSLFTEASIKQMMAAFEKILKKITTNPEIKISEITKADISIYGGLNDTFEEYPDASLGEIIAQQARLTPNNKVLKFLDNEISYAEFDERVNQLAHILTEKGVSSGEFVGVCLPRSIELIITLNAILRCGAAYVPLDPTYPSQRLNYMIEDSGAKSLISTEELASTLGSEITLLRFDDLFSNLSNYPNTPIPTKVAPSSIAYLLYTSGSTGKPKGVMVTHKNLTNFLHSVKEKPGITASDRLLCITNFSFDMSVLDLYLPLISGATLVIAHEDISKDGRLLLEILKKERITMIQATPTTWQMLLDSGWKESLPIKAICGAEPWSLNLAQDLLPKIAELWNMYGPTETTVWSARKQITKNDEFISIGHPIGNTQIYIMNEHNQLMSAGKTGEIVIGGDGVSLGYWNRSELTAEKFIDNRIDQNDSSKLYRTGDLGKLLSNGELQCVGRIDHQVKIRGHRIELGEIEQLLNSIDEVKTSVVVVNDNALIAHVTTNDSNTTEANFDSWKEVLRNNLPAYMVPHRFILVDEFPTNLNGKIDRKALTDNLINNFNTVKTEHTAPTTTSEKIITEIWKDCLGLDKIDVNSDFFELGGHSLLGNKAMAILEKETGKRVPLVALLEHSTIKKLAAFMDKEFFTWDSLVPLKPKGTKPPLYIVHGANHHVLLFNELARKLDKDQPVFGLQSRGLNGKDEPHDSIDEMAADYVAEIIASNPEGPYALAGFSYGGIIAFEMARQLKAQGREVKILAQFDAYVFPQYYYNDPLKKKIISILYLLGKIVFVLLNMFTSKKNFIRRIQLIRFQIEGVFLRLKHGQEKQFEMQRNVRLKMQTNHDIAASRYTISPQDIVIDLFKATEDVILVHDHKFLGWKKIARKGIRRHMIFGNHREMFEKPHVEDFAAILQHVLDNHNSKKL